jgi:signal transduction histidine kinase
LGLGVVQGIINEHRGGIQFDSTPGHGTCCTLEFPLDNPSAANAEPRTSSP